MKRKPRHRHYYSDRPRPLVGPGPRFAVSLLVQEPRGRSGWGHAIFLGNVYADTPDVALLRAEYRIRKLIAMESEID